MRGTHKQAKDYCSKENTRVSPPVEFGEMPQQGRRVDLEGLLSDIKAGVPQKQLVETHFPLFLRHASAIQKIKEIYDYDSTPVFRDVRVEVWWGPTGTGKSTELALRYPDGYFTTGRNLKWFNGYTGQEVLIIDEFYGQAPITLMLSILQPIRLRLEIKNGHVYARWTQVFITSNVAPWLWYRRPSIPQQVWEALQRRIHVTKEITEPWYERNRVVVRSDIPVGLPLRL